MSADGCRAAFAVRQHVRQDAPAGRMCRVPAGAHVGVDARTHARMEGMRVWRLLTAARGEVMQHLRCRVLLKTGWLHEQAGMKSLNLDVGNGNSKR